MGEDPDARPAVAHRADDVGLEAKVHDPDPGTARTARNVRNVRTVRGILGDRRKRDLADEVLVLPARHVAGGGECHHAVHLARRGHDPAQASTGAQVPGERASVDAGNGRDRVVAQERRQLASPVEHRCGGIGDDQRTQPRPDRLIVVEQAPVVADQRVGHDHDLSGVRGVRAHLLVASLARVHDQIAAGRDGCPERDAGEDRTILEHQQRGTKIADARVNDRGGARRRGKDHEGRAGSVMEPVGRGTPCGRGARRNSPPIGDGTVDLPPSRPHRTGTPASRDRP